MSLLGDDKVFTELENVPCLELPLSPGSSSNDSSDFYQLHSKSSDLLTTSQNSSDLFCFGDEPLSAIVAGNSTLQSSKLNQSNPSYPSIQSILKVTGTVDVEQFNQGFAADSGKDLNSICKPRDKLFIETEKTGIKRLRKYSRKPTKVKKVAEEEDIDDPEEVVGTDIETRKGRQISDWHKKQLILLAVKMNQTDLTTYGITDISHGVLDDNEDLFHQLSADLGLPDFLQETRTSSSSSSSVSSNLGMETGSLMEDQLMQDISSLPADTNSLFPEVSSADSAYCGSIKSEPNSPFSDVLFGAPSSPSCSEDNSPPLSPNQHLGVSISTPTPLKTNLNTVVLNSDGMVVNPEGIINVITTSNVPNSSIQTIQGASCVGKIAIPKIRKPAPPPQQPATTLATPLVLQLGNDGRYYTNTATTTAPLIIKTEPTGLPNNSYCSPLVAGMPTVTSSNSSEDMRNLKRQQRMIKNRESACISRKKKKEYLTNLEDQIKILSNENMCLINENESLKSKVRELESEKKLWADSIFSSPKAKKVTAMFALLFMVSVNVGSLGGLMKGVPSSPKAPSPSIHFPRTDHLHDSHGRSLLWVEDDAEVEDVVEVEFPANFTGFDKPPPMCPMFFNQSESIRLESELRGWFNIDLPHQRRQQQEERVNRKRPDITSKPKVFKKSGEKLTQDQPLGNVIKTPLHSLTGSVYNLLIQEPSTPKGSHAIGLYEQAPRYTFASFFEAIDRKDDTFYVVSFSGDHLLVPATNHSQANRPRMSLLLPAMQVSLNESHRGPPDTIAMMKIDCEVMNTQLIHVNQDAIPVHMAANLRSGNLSGEGKTSDEGRTSERDEKTDKSNSSEYAHGRNYRNSNREELRKAEKDNVTLENEIGNIPELDKFRKSHRNEKKKTKFGSK